MSPITPENFFNRNNNAKRWLKKDLIEFCENHELSCLGTVSDLTERVATFCHDVGVIKLTKNLNRLKLCGTKNQSENLVKNIIKTSVKSLPKSPTKSSVPKGFKKFIKYKPSKEHKYGKISLKYVSYKINSGRLDIYFLPENSDMVTSYTVHHDDEVDSHYKELITTLESNEAFETYIDGYCTSLDDAENLFRINISKS